MVKTLVHGEVELGTKRSQVWYSSSTVYAFYVLTGSGGMAYRYSTDAGATWSASAVILDTPIAEGNIFYERWANPQAQPVVHILGNDSSTTPGLHYNSINLITRAKHTAGGTRIVTTSAGAATSFGLCVTRGGRICAYLVTGVGAGQAFRYSDDGGDTWTTGSTFTLPYLARPFLEPDLSSPRANDILLVFFTDSGTDRFTFRRWDGDADSWSDETVLFSYGSVSQTDLRFAVLSNRHTQTTFATAFSADSGSRDLQVFEIGTSAVVQRTNIFTADSTVIIHTLAVLPNGYLIAPYFASSRVRYKISKDAGVTWGDPVVYSSEDHTVDGVYGIMIDPAPLVGQILPMYHYTSDDDLNVEAPGVTADPTQYRLMLSDGVDPDIPIYNITPLNAGKSGAMLTRFERGRERAVIGEPPRAGALTTRVKNDSTALGYSGAPSAAWTLDEPAPGLAVRLNKSLDSGVTWSHMAQGNIDTIQHHFGADGFRSLIDIRANGPFAKLSGKKVTTSLYQGITTGEAIDVILDELDVPAHLRDIATGVVILDWWWLADADAMTSIVQLVNTEGLTADLFEAGDGKITFRDRNARYTDSRSATAQSTFTSEGTEPRFTGFDYTPGFREIVNEAKATRYRLTVDPAPASTTVWEDGDGISYIVPPNGTLVVEATTTLPVSSAITPVSGTDYTVGLGSAVATLNRVSGSRFTITYTNSDGLGATLANLQLRASTQYIQHGPIEEVSGGLASVRVDVDDSVAAYGLRPWQGSMWSYIGHADMRDNLDVITTVKKDPRAWVRIGLNAEGGTARNTATAERELGDRIRIINSNPGVEFNEFCWIERIEHEVQAPEREITFYECTPITGALGTNPYDSITNGAGVDTSDEGGSATGTGSTGSSGSSSPSPIALYGFAAGNQLTTFNGVRRITGGDATNIANLIAAGADNAKILIDNGVSITLTSQLVLGSFAKLYVPHGGSASISGGSLAGAAIYLDGATDVLIGGLNITSAPGDYTSGNNPAAAIEITGASDRIQIVGTTITSPTFGGAVTDAPEGVNIWNNSGTAAGGPGSVTFYRVYWPVAGAGNSTAKSKGVIAGGTTTATRNALTFYECVFSAWQRLPFVQDGAIADIVNCVYPNIDRIDAIEVEDGGEARARASVFRNSTDGSHAWETRNLGGGYIAEGPEANDYQNSADFTEVSPSQVFTVPYSLTVNTAAYVNTNVESNTGAGSVIIPE